MNLVSILSKIGIATVAVLVGVVAMIGMAASTLVWFALNIMAIEAIARESVNSRTDNLVIAGVTTLGSIIIGLFVLHDLSRKN